MSVDLTVYCRPWSGSEQVEPNQAEALYIDHVTANGHTLHTFSPEARRVMDMLEKGERPEPYEHETPFQLLLDGFSTLNVRYMTDECWAHFNAEDWLEGSTKDDCYLIIKSLKIVRLPVEDPALAEV